ncbi:hypothetical protein Ahy_B08g093922 [Arachis hypogaea]|uniref:Aminotransferase-like plant mobile domain-containing protein n=1 Tax=Arachis hypogaea TaxID=3818 RepID=A0A444Y7C2_ARAHY|nr:hypothetical protein Ahy_B08g093922 [Arachis hypogaea]
MPFGECTITLQDLAYQFGLPINGHAVSRCLSNFEPLMEGRKPVWNKFRDLPANASEATVQIYARDYIMMLLSTALFADKSTCVVSSSPSLSSPTIGGSESDPSSPITSANGSLSLTSMNTGAPSTTGAAPIAIASSPKIRPSPKSSVGMGKSAVNDDDETKGVTGCLAGIRAGSEPS